MEKTNFVIDIKWLIIVALLLTGLIFFLTCNTKKVLDFQYKIAFEQSKKRADSIESSYADFRKESDSVVSQAMEGQIQANERADSMYVVTQSSLEAITDLQGKLAAARGEKPGADWVRVSPNYRDACDSIDSKFTVYKVQVAQSTIAHQEQLASLNKNLMIKDGIIQVEKNFNKLFQAELDSCNALGKKATSGRSAQNTWFYGGALWGNKQSILGGAEANISVLNKRNVMYELKGGYFKDWYIGIGTRRSF